ncbi:MAG: DUF2190 family protein [Cellvibrionaceae bacterium]
MNNYIQPGKAVSFTAPADVASGSIVSVGSLVGVACSSVLSGEEGEMVVEGVFELPKNPANTPDQFDKAYWDSGSSVVTTTATDNALIGVFMKADATGKPSCEVRLNGVSI